MEDRGSRIYGPEDFSEYRLERGKIFGPLGDTECYILGTSIFGEKLNLPWVK